MDDGSSTTPPPAAPSSLAPGPGPLTPLPSPPHPGVEPHTATPSSLSASRTIDIDLTAESRESPGTPERNGDAEHEVPPTQFADDSDEAMDDVSDEADDATPSGSSSWLPAQGSLATSAVAASPIGNWGLPIKAGGRRGNKSDRAGGSGAKAFALGADGERQETNKVLDKDYKGKFDFDPFLDQLHDDEVSTAAAAAVIS